MSESASSLMPSGSCRGSFGDFKMLINWRLLSRVAARGGFIHSLSMATAVSLGNEKSKKEKLSKNLN